MRVSVTDQVLKVTEAPVIASGGVQEIKVIFDFCSLWDGFAKTAVFYQDPENRYLALVDENDTCIVPQEVYTEAGNFYFGVFGELGETVRTSTVVKCKVREGAITAEGTPADPTLDIYDQIMAELAETRSIVQSIRDDADTIFANAETATNEATQAAESANTATASVNEAIQGANTATSNANTATDNANQAAEAANTATESANTAAVNANTATEATNEAREAMLADTEEAIADINEFLEDGDYAPPIITSADGEVIAVSDSALRPLKGLKLYGKTTQDGTPTPDAPVAMVSVENPVVTVGGKNLFPGHVTNYENEVGSTVTVNADGSITVHKVAGAELSFRANMYFPAGTYAISNGLDDGHAIYLQAFSEALYSVPIKVIEWPGGMTAVFLFSKDTTEGDVTLFPQIELSNTATPYEPYKPIQSMETTRTIPGIPVSSGGNYTDADGQQWICDEVDFERGVYVQRINKATYSGAEEEWVALYGTVGNGFAVSRKSDDYLPPESAYVVMPAYCDKLSVASTSDIYSQGQDAEFAFSTSGSVIRFSLDALNGCTADEVRTWLASNPLTFMYILKDPIETALTDEELAEYAALHSYCPNTTVGNDAGAWMELTYNADTKTYIEERTKENVEAYLEENPVTGVTSWNDLEDKPTIPTDEDINALIDAKLGVIENGTY